MGLQEIIQSYFIIVISSWQWPRRHKTTNFIWIPMIPKNGGPNRRTNYYNHWKNSFYRPAANVLICNLNWTHEICAIYIHTHIWLFLCSSLPFRVHFWFLVYILFLPFYSFTEWLNLNVVLHIMAIQTLLLILEYYYNHYFCQMQSMWCSDSRKRRAFRI